MRNLFNGPGLRRPSLGLYVQARLRAKNILISFLNSILKTDRITDVEYDSFGRIKQIFSVENYCF